ncbi:TPA: PD-(D/E)XK motif protein [Bacillus cereus]|uniref:PD-(D/E)XK motif protein n=1 Tax=Bacillus cereus TaxID=1396 RepID=UPI00192767FF|nr:PD-(D/E)XK motif protein [Bacillus cereus]MBL3889620.1 PD-(D/E)XK motif protein [Bacillus cereus]HDX9508668.1 PD-(D/E)XK motif protein [Bacillus cereus]
MDRIRMIFSEMESDIQAKSTSYLEGKLIIRLLENKRAFSIYVAVDYEFKRMFLLSVPKRIDETILKMLPTWKGICIRQEKFKNPLYNKEEWFLVIEQRNALGIEIYESLIGDLYENIKMMNTFNSMLTKLHQILEKWQHFFSKNRIVGLSIEEQKGLFGELIFMNSVLKNYVSPAIVDFWYGPDEDLTDYHFPYFGVEVKTTVATKPYKVMISNEKQLEMNNVKKLYLCSVLIENNNQEGTSINDLVIEIKNQLREFPSTIELFESKLFHIGYLEAQSDIYEENKFVVVNSYYFMIDENFPRIISSDLPEGISNVKYQLLLDSCKDHMIDNEKLFGEIREQLI